ncbi:MAG: alpha/beta hydrolase [Nitrospira sp.]
MSKDAYIHKVLPGSPGSPLLFVFHGTGADENQLLDFGRELCLRRRSYRRAATCREHGAARFFRRTGEGVYDMDDLARATAKMTGFVKAHVEAAKPSAVLGLGYSNGANILASVVFAEPGLFDAAALMHPLIPFEPRSRAALPAAHILITAGRRDPICPPNLTSRLEAYLHADGADVTVEWHDGGHEVRPNEIEAARRLFASLNARRRRQENG